MRAAVGNGQRRLPPFATATPLVHFEIIADGVKQGQFQKQEPEITANMITVMIHSWALKGYNLKKFSFYSFQKVLLNLVMTGVVNHEDETA